MREAELRKFSVLAFCRAVIHGATVDPWRRAGLETGHRQSEGFELLSDVNGSRVTRASRGDGGAGPDVNPAPEERPRSDDDRPRTQLPAVGGSHPAHPIALDQQGCRGPLEQIQKGIGLEHSPHSTAIEHTVALRTRRPDGWTLGAIEHAELDGARIRRATHDSAERIYLPDHGPLGDSTDGRVAGHLSDGLESAREQERASAEPGGGGCALGAGVAPPDHDDIMILVHAGEYDGDRRTGRDSGCVEMVHGALEGLAVRPVVREIRAMASYTNLKAWQHARRLAVECARATRPFPRHERSVLARRIRQQAYRTASRIASAGVADGASRRAALAQAQQSLAATEALLRIAHDLEYLANREFARLEAWCVETGKTLYGLRRKLAAG